MMVSLDLARTLVERRGIPVSKVHLADRGPPIVESPAFREPLVLWDILQGAPIRPYYIWSPEGDHEVRRQAYSSRHDKFTPTAVREIREQYWSGQDTIKNLAAVRRVSYQTMWKMVHLITYWWV